MRATAFIRDCIENKEKTKLIPSAIAGGKTQYGMQTFDQSIYDLFAEGLITYEEALRQATNPDDFKLKVSGIHSTSDLSHEAKEAGLENSSDYNPHDPSSPFEFSGS